MPPHTASPDDTSSSAAGSQHNSAPHGTTLQHTAPHCHALQYLAHEHLRTPHDALSMLETPSFHHDSDLPPDRQVKSVWCSMVQGGAGCCRVLQRVAV